MKNLWSLKGSMTLLSLADGFFLLKFTTVEDLEMILSGGPWFLLGKPFILQRWSPKFKPKRDEDAPIPIWIKIVDFPLALWTPTGISKISSFIGIPISVDSLTASRSRLTFARVCVLINKDSILHDEIPIEIDGEDLVLKVLYDWKPDKCEGCGSIIHPYSLCPKNPNPQHILPPQPPKNRGRSSSRPHNSRPHRPHRSPTIVPPPKPTPQTVNVESNVTMPPPTSNSGNLPPAIPPPITNPPIPNLNSPSQVSASSEIPTSPRILKSPKIPLLNMFASLQTDDTIPVDTLDINSESGSASCSNAVTNTLTSNSQEKIIHNTRASSDKGKTQIKSKPPKGKSAKKAKSQFS
ncbi:RNA exonuclease 1 [Dendrobium catenatum]|uniref:RNA exonuclease 1 n=1 Tax=Dendrobium catenatum TaxID=906689 RepID=A0A2I0WSB3_9ASPA|nr:RNA exonuclease 1 [Dendrobium catenatum]